MSEQMKRRRERLERLARGYAVGDVVYERDTGHVGVVTEAGRIAVRVVFWHGGLRGGPMVGLRHVRPRLNLPVPEGARGLRGWNRQQAVTAALRRAGLMKEKA